MVYLSDKTSGRDNNLNLIRAIAATAVLVSHAYPIALGPEAYQPLQVLTGYTLGTLSVYAFFVISGFLISMSFMRSSSWLSFLIARVLRLVPGLFVSLLAVGFVLAPIVTTLSTGSYFSNLETYTFIIRNMLLLPLQYYLPGVFDNQPYTAVVGSIWTLFYEVFCYVGVFVVGVAGLLRSRLWMSLGFVAYLGFWFFIEVNGAPHPRINSLQELSLPFAIGMAFFIWQDKLPLSLMGVLILSVIAWAVRETVFYELMLTLALSYGVFWVGYIPAGILRAYNQVGDYSYGIYIYAFPLQGFAVWLMGGDVQSPLMNMAISFPLTLICSIASWHLIENPALNAKSVVMARVNRA